MESLAHAVDNTYKLCCPVISKQLSNKDFKKPWISREIISNIKKWQHYFALYCQNKISKDFYTHFEILSPGKHINTKNRKVENTVKKMIHDDVVHVDSGDIANMFNDYFVDIGRNIAESIGGNNADYLDYMTHIKNLILFSSDQLIVTRLKN